MYDVRAAVLKERLILRRKGAATTFTFKIHDPRHRLGKAKMSPSGGWGFSGAVGDGLTMSLAAPMAWQQGNAASAMPGDGSAHHSVTRTGTGYLVRLSVDRTWLRGKEFPIVLDPTQTYAWADGTLGTAYAPLDESACDGSPCPLASAADGSLFVGWNNSDYDGFAFNHQGFVHTDLSNIPPWTRVVSANLSLQPSHATDCSYFTAQGNNAPLRPGDIWSGLSSGESESGANTFEAVEDGGSSASPRESADVTSWVTKLVEGGAAGETNFTLLNHPACTRQAPGRPSSNDPITPSGYGDWLSDVRLTLEYEGALLPPPLPVEQTWGCDCRWGHGSDTVRWVADPISTASGHIMEHGTDLTSNAPGIPLRFSRTYNDQDDTEGPLGTGWTHEYAASISEDPATGDATFRDPTGARSLYVLQPGGTYIGDPGALLTMSRTTGGGWQLTSTTGERLTFDAQGREISDVDREGRGVTLDYTGSGATSRLTTITDSNNAAATLSYGTSGAADGKLISVNTADGRSVTYDYATVGGASMLHAVTDPNGDTTEYAYDSAGRLVGIANPLQQESAQNTYDLSTGRITGQIDAAGGTWAFDWESVDGAPEGSGTMVTTDPAGSVTRDLYYGHVLLRHTDGVGKTTRYAYDDDLNVVGITDPRGFVTTMTYDSRGNMLSRIAPQPVGTTESWTYNANDQVTSHTDGRGKTTTFVYNGNQQLTASTDPLAHTTHYTHTADGLPGTITTPEGHVTDFDYDSQGNLVSQETPAGARTTWTYDTAGNVAIETDPRGNEPGADPDDYATTYTHDAAGRLTSTTDPDGTVTTSHYDAAGRHTGTTTEDAQGNVLVDSTSTYDPMGRLLTSTDFDRTTLTNTYDRAGRITSTTDATGAKTTYRYDGAGRLAGKTTPRGNLPDADPDAYTWSYSYDENGNRYAVTDPMWNTVYADYDAVNRPTTITSPNGAQTITEYNDNGQPVAVTDPLGNITTTTYDDAGHITGVARPGEDPTTITYDDDGNRTSETSPSGESTTTWTYTNDGQVASTVDPAGNRPTADPDDYRTTYNHDAAGNRTETTDQLGHTTTTTYDHRGNPLTQTDARNHITTWDYDPLGRVLSVDPPGTAGPTTYAYNQYGDMVTRTDPKAHATTYAYDAAHRTTSVTDALDRAATRTYDAEGNVASWTTARGNQPGANQADWTVTNTWDARGLLTARTTNAAATDVTYTYDADSRMDTMTDSRGTTQFSYDLAGHLTSLDQPDEDDYAYTYTETGQVASRTYPHGGTIDYTYDGDGLPATQTSDGLTTTYAYNANRALKSITYPTGTDTTQTRDYDRAGRIHAVTNEQAGSSTPLSRFTYTRDANGNPTLIERTRGTTTHEEAFTYGPQDWLTRHCPTSTTCDNATDYIAYTYDQVGNRLQMDRVGNVPKPGTTTYTYDVADQLTNQSTTTSAGTTSASYTYDADGNLTSGGRAWNVLGQLTTSHVDGPTPSTYTYDGLGNRRTTTGTDTTDLSWDINNPLPMIAVITTPDTNHSAQRYTPEGFLLQSQHDSESYPRTFYAHDAQGSITDGIKSNGTPSFATDYDAWGLPDTTSAHGAVTSPFGYTSAYTEPGTGELHLRIRDYNPDIGRFQEVDPHPYAARPFTSPYLYTDNRPTLHSDPSGLCWGPDVVCNVATAPFEAGGHFLHGSGQVLTGSFWAIGAGGPQQHAQMADQGNGMANDGMREAGPAGLELLTYMLLGEGAGTAAASESALARLCAWGGGLGGRKTAANAAPRALSASSRVAPWAGASLSRLSREGEVMYRVYGGGAGRAGSWLTPISPVSSAAARQGLALPPENAALFVSRVTLPGGVRMQVGTAGSAFGQPGGWAQAQLLERIPLSSFGKGVPLQ